ncbi:PmoA family protein [Tundrisphaera lichenicola]|uniref:DUF6807 domain-containing protein n=1 Tax=Tundrisphaera lichenicola TaxID=2029860 RepID=UPI003EBD5E98
MICSFRTLIGALVASALLMGSAPADQLLTFKVDGTGKELGETPLIFELTKPIGAGPAYAIKPLDGGPSLPATVFKDEGKLYLGTVLDRLPARGQRAFELIEAPADRSSSGVAFEEGQGKKIGIVVGGQPLMTYVPDDGPKPYYFPVIGPTGKRLTRAYPMEMVEGEKRDHPHHRSLWFTHGSVNKIDFWSELPNHGTIRETSRSIVGGAAVGLIRTTDDWIGPDGKKVCEDERVVRIYSTKSTRVIDFDVTLKATVGPVVFGDTKEGSFGARVATSMDVTSNKGGKIVNADGITDKDAWGKPSPWVDYTGPVDGQTVGIAILNHPDSFRYPTTWHVRDYGLFAANPFGYHDFGMKNSGEYTLPKGQSIRFVYRMILHEGATSLPAMTAAFEGFASPPKVTISE